MPITATISKTGTHTWRLTLLLFLLVGLIIISLTIGAVSISVMQIVNAIGYHLGFTSSVNETHELVLFNIRLPRLLLTVLVGGALGISGACLQGLFRNPLVEPGLIGVSSGAALGAITVIMFIGQIAPQFAKEARSWLMPLFAFGGGAIATFIAVKLSRFKGKTHITYLILAGVAINALAGALIGLSVFYADETELRTYTFWTLGDVSVATWDKLKILFPLITLSCAGLLNFRGALNAMALGEPEAFHSGVPVEKVKLLIVLLGALAVGTSVAFTGIIGFVGLVVPHIIRISFSSDHNLVLPASALGGACLLILADMVARTIVQPAELPIGVVTSVIGAPFFLYLLISTKKQRLL